MNIFDDLKLKVEDLLIKLGFVLWEIDIGNGYMNVYAERNDTGIGVEDCSRIAESIRFMLKSGHYPSDNISITVSSPGINRRLTRPEHYQKMKGKMVKVITTQKINDTNFFNSRLIDAGNGVIFLENGSTDQIPIPVHIIKECRIAEI